MKSKLKNMRVFTVIVFSIISFNAFSQSDIPLNQWESYLPYQNVRFIEESNDRVLFATEWSILSYNPNENSFDYLSKVEGLSDIGISRIAYDSFNDQLIIAYRNSNMDILSGTDVFNKSDIKENGTLTGDRSINDIHIANEEFLYLSTAFGIVEQNLKNLEFGPTIFTNSIVYQIANQGSILYAATEDGIYFVDIDQSINIADFSTWSLMDTMADLPLVYPCENIIQSGNTIYAVVDNQLKKLVQGVFEDIYEIPNGFVPRFLRENGDVFSLGIYDEEFTSHVLYFDDNGSLIRDFDGCNNLTTDALQTKAGRIYLGDEWNEIRCADDIQADCKRIVLNTPNTHEVSDIELDEDEIYIATGGVSDAYTSLDSRQGFYVYKEKDWETYSESRYSPIKDENFLNFYKVLKHPSEDLLYIGSYFGGLMELDLNTNESNFYHKDNSALQGTIGNENRTRVAGMAFDDSKNLWMTNFGAPEPLVVFLNGGGELSFPVVSSRNLADIAIDQSGLIWAVVAGNPGGILVYDPGELPQDPSDDGGQRFINLGVIVNTIEVDKDGDVWVGTAEGPYIFECGASAIDNDCQGTQRKVLQDSIAAFLLQTENIRSIEIDGANRKWFGTRNGIFVQSPDGEEQIFNFDVDNSPLFDNSVNALRFNGKTGEMFIGTNKGVQSIRTESLDGNARHAQEVYAFPNPVRSDYTGPIAIKGLANDAEVKITDINGKLIYETDALGGQAIWNGNDYNGRRAASGVYLVFSSSTESFDSPDSYVTKILLVN